MSERLFLALWPDQAVCDALHRLACALHQQFGGKPVPQANLHLTLAFLGAVSTETRRQLEHSVCVNDIPAFALTLDALGFLLRPQVVWVGCRETPEGLVAMVSRIRETLQAFPVAHETRPYLTHITLLKKVKTAASFPQFEPINWTVRRIVLVKSQTLPGGAEYESMKEWALAPG